MSLINDALKRAGKSIKQRGPAPAETARLHAVESTRGPSRVSLIGVPVLLVALFCFGGWVLWRHFHTIHAADANPAITNVPAATVATTLPVSQPAVPADVGASESPRQTTPPPAEPPPSAAAAVTTEPPQVNAPMAKSDFPPLKLQGIAYRRLRPSVLINGHYVYKGETVDGVKVIAIERQSATVEFEGHRKVLHLD
jgi:hypothetical protein